MPDVRRPPSAGQGSGSSFQSPHVAFRVSLDVLARVDALVPAVSPPWRQAKRSDVLRAALIMGLPLMEAQYAPAKGAAPRGKGGAR